MTPRSPTWPVVDLHCDLLCYLAEVEGADANRRGDIGCAIPSLLEGGVRLQVLAIYTAVDSDSVASALRQAGTFRDLLESRGDTLLRICDAPAAEGLFESDRIGVVASIENASALCTEDEPLCLAQQRLQKIIDLTGGVLSISLTHHGENRFGGGNASSVGLKEDGRALLELIAGRRIALDLSHASDALARDALDHIDRASLDLPVMASHSNFRSVWDTARNLPDWLAAEIVRRRGVIGISLLRAMVHPTDASALLRHLEHGLSTGCGPAMCLGADYFHVGSHPDPSRAPFFFAAHEHAGRYPQLLASLAEVMTPDQVQGVAFRNALGFVGRLWAG